MNHFFSDIFAYFRLNRRIGSGRKEPDYLVLVNKTHRIPQNYLRGAVLVDIAAENGKTVQLEKRTCEAFLGLRSALLTENVEIGVYSGYRSLKMQQYILDKYVRKYGEDYAVRTVAMPGTSEHHTGLALDIVLKIGDKWVVENAELMKETETFAVIYRKLPQYGFILRYPEGKEKITGFEYEPWHFRYVGEKAAQEIYDACITLEEYLR